MILDHQSFFNLNSSFLEKSSSSNFPYSYEGHSKHRVINPKIGEGYFDFHYFKNFSLERSELRLEQEINFINKKSYSPFNIYIVLSGELTLYQKGSNKRQIIKTGEVFASNQYLENVETQIPAHTKIKNLVITFDEKFINMLSKEMPNNSLAHYFLKNQSSYLQLLPVISTEIIKLSKQLYFYSYAQNQLQLMSIQGGIFSLISLLLNTPILNTTLNNDAQQVKLLLDEYYSEKWTIKRLARHVGTNECYLKKDFKILTGLSINNYLQKKRMEIALEILKNGEHNFNIIASRLGYSNKDYFIRVFNKYYGFHPKDFNI